MSKAESRSAMIANRLSDQGIFLVDLVRAYSNRGDLAFELARVNRLLADAQVSGTGQRRSVQSDRSATNADWRLADRLGVDDIADMVEQFASGTAKWRIAEQYGISLSSVKRLLSKHRPAA